MHARFLDLVASGRLAGHGLARSIDRPLSAICHHESGHACVALLNNADVFQVSCIPDRGPDGSDRAGHCSFDCVPPHTELLIIHAGELAEARHLGLPVQEGLRSDKARARQLALQVDRRRPEEVLMRTWRETATLLNTPSIWMGIAALAFELELCGVLRGREARRIFWEALR